MANIPGISGSQQPGVFVRDRVISRGVSIPGGLRITCIMGEGLREETVVVAAVGGGEDGSAFCSPTGDPSGRFFRLQNWPVVSGRTQLFLNGNILTGTEQAISTSSFGNEFDFRIATDTGCIELQGASIADQDGANFSASSLNVGNGFIIDGTCGDTDLISVIDESAPGERWTVRVVGVIRDSNGDPVPGLATLTLTGSVSGQLRDEYGQPILFHSSYYTASTGAASGSDDACADGFVVATSDDFGLGSSVIVSGDATALTTSSFEFPGNLVVQGQGLVGDELCVDGYVGIEIEDIDYDSTLDTTTLSLVTDSLATGPVTTDVDWEIRATNLFIDDESVLHNGVTGIPATDGSFTSASLGKVLTICSGDTAGQYLVDQVTSSRRLRVSRLSDSTLGFPALEDDDADGLSETGLEFHMLETNGVLLFGVDEGTVPLEVGDKFFIDVRSKVLKANDSLEARYIAVADINDPQYFESPADLAVKHGRPSTTNALSLGAQMAFENGAPLVLAVQCKPPIPRRTSVTLIEEVDSNGDGGFTACGGAAADCEIDDLKFIIPRSFEGIGDARPDGDTSVNIFVVRDDEETQIFPNKVNFYNPQLESAVGQNGFISSSDTAFSYTVINTDVDVTGQGYNGQIVASAGTFSTLEVDFDAVDVGSIIVVQSLETTAGLVKTTEAAISTHLYPLVTTPTAELIITGIVDDSTVTVRANTDVVGVSLRTIVADATDIQFFVKDPADTTNVDAALLLHSDLVDSGTLQVGDGIRISYIDETDADFFDTNWFNAFESLEIRDCQIVVPLPAQNRNGIFRAAVTHVETMSSIAIQKERVAFFGAQQGVTADALLGRELIAVEDIGVLEGIQGDDPEEVLSGNTEDLQNFKLNDSFTTNRAKYYYPDQIVRNVQGTNVFLDGFYMAAAGAGWYSGRQNVALSQTNKVLQGFTILRDREFRPTTLNELNGVGATVVQPVIGGGRVLSARTTSTSGFIEDEEASVIFIRDRVKAGLREGLKGFIGTTEDPNTHAILGVRVKSLMSKFFSEGIITDFENIRVEQDKVDPRQWNIFLRFQPAFPINFIFVDIEVGVIA